MGRQGEGRTRKHHNLNLYILIAKSNYCELEPRRLRLGRSEQPASKPDIWTMVSGIWALHLNQAFLVLESERLKYRSSKREVS
jgi:hypothetical protein